jgi:hypothetical protein
MPNFWSSTTRQIYEAFAGPGTVDSEFNLKVEEMKMAEKNIENIQKIFRNFHTDTKGIKKWLQDIYSSYASCYTNNSPHYPIVNEILLVHQELEHLYDIFVFFF